MRAAIIYDAGSAEWSSQDVAAVLSNVHEVRTALRRRDYDVELVPVRLGEFRWLSRARKADLVVNLCEGINGHAKYEDFVVNTLELTGLPFTGCRAWPVTVCHRKHVANTLLRNAGVPIPSFVLTQGNSIPGDIPLPAIVKPAAEDASVGIDGSAVCTTRKALRKRVVHMTEQFEDVMIQQYVPGREINVGFVGRQMLPLSEIRFDSMPPDAWPIVTYAAKWSTGSPDDLGTVPVCPAAVSPELAKRIAHVAWRAWELLAGAEGYGRVDIRVTEDGQPYVLEVNPSPDLSSDAGLARMAQAFGWSYDELVHRIVDEALTRMQPSRFAAELVSGVPAA
ncbi:MAG: D-alanine--D-alanine ligase family protein [Deltaproteobacteria bacterium]|jgi:D-alanine-D-alanine ligase